MSFLISSPLSARMLKSSPNTLMAISALTPVMSSLNRISMGCVNSSSIPGMISSTSLKRSANSSLLLALVHCFRGCNVMITSLSSILMGSVGTSAAPILDTIWFTSSGNSSFKIRSIWVVISTVFARDVPVFKTG